MPNSATTPALTAGNALFQAQYSGDGIYAAATSACEAISVSSQPRLVGSAVHDAATGLPWNGAEVTGASAFATAVAGALPDPGGVAPTGSVTY